MPIAMNRAKAARIDEFYTLFPDVELELQHYGNFFEGKVVYCCCDNPKWSSFCKYFCANFQKLKIRRFICSWMPEGESSAQWAEYDVISQKYVYHNISAGNGCFDCPECICLMNMADVVVTNPPFSRTLDFIELLIAKEKKFVIVCNRNTIVTKKVFPLLLNRKVRIGFGFKGNTACFIIPPSLYGHYSNDVVRHEKNIVRFRDVTWLTNFEIEVPSNKIQLHRKYSQHKYKKYDEYDAINVDKLSDIPYDYDGVMGVPITILDKFDYNSFELLGLDRFMPLNKSGRRFTIKGKEKYARVLIQKRKHE